MCVIRNVLQLTKNNPVAPSCAYKWRLGGGDWGGAGVGWEALACRYRTPGQDLKGVQAR